MASTRDRITSWQAPLFNSPPSYRVGWVEEQIEEGEGWLQSQRAYKEINQNYRIFDAFFNDKSKSQLITNELKYDIRKFVETLSDQREIGTYGSDNPLYRNYVEMQNKLIKNVYLEAEFPLAVRKALQYAAVIGRGYLWPKCKTANYGWGERKLIFDTLGLMDLVPVQVPASNNVQEAYINTIYEYMPIVEAHARFPLFADKLQPLSRMRFNSSMAGRRVDHAERFRYGDESRSFGNLYCEIRWTFIRDIRINPFSVELPMGTEGTSWFYKVPYIGQSIFGGFVNGKPTMRPARGEDCQLYPQLRLIITNKGMDCPMYDGPAYDWDGEMPAVQYDVDDYPWDGVGRSLVGDVGTIQQTIRKIERKMDQVVTVTLNPPMGYDRNSVQGPKIEQFDLFEEDVRSGMDGNPSQVFTSLLPESVKVEEIHFKYLEYLHAAMGKQLGLEDVANLAQLKMNNIASDAAEKMLESIGPVGRGIAASVERASAKIAYRLKFMIPQWYDTNRVVQILGPQSITPEVFDYDPRSLVPSHMVEEGVKLEPGVPAPVSFYSDQARARRFAANMRVVSVPSTLLRVTQMQEQLKYLNLQRGGFPLANVDLAKKLDIENYGEVDGATGRERFMNEQMEDLLQKAKIAAEAQKLGLIPPPEVAGEGGGGAAPGAPPPRKGRKPTFSAPPKLEQKGDGRTTVSTSK